MKVIVERERGKLLRRSRVGPSWLHISLATHDLCLFQSARRSGIGGQAEKKEGYGQQVELIHLLLKRVVMWEGGVSSKLEVGTDARM
jgi:hypothetical protein